MKMRSILMSAALGAMVMGSANASTFYEKEEVTLRALDKITGRSTDISVAIGEPFVFGSLKVEVKSCYQTPPEEPPESAAFMQIYSTKPLADSTDESGDTAENVMDEDGNPRLFSAWMYASSPGLSALEHPVYDIWVIRCTIQEPTEVSEEIEDPFAIPDGLPGGAPLDEDGTMSEDLLDDASASVPSEGSDLDPVEPTDRDELSNVLDFIESTDNTDDDAQ